MTSVFQMKVPYRVQVDQSSSEESAQLPGNREHINPPHRLSPMEPKQLRSIPEMESKNYPGKRLENIVNKDTKVDSVHGDSAKIYQEGFFMLSSVITELSDNIEKHNKQTNVLLASINEGVWKTQHLAPDVKKEKKAARQGHFNILSKSNGKIPVIIRVVFVGIGEIDTVKENFDADVFVQVKWREPKLDRTAHLATETPDEFDPSHYWNPKIKVNNLLKDPKESKWYHVHHDKRGHAYILEKRRVKGTFLEFMELKNFPFDIQDLTVTLVSEQPADSISLEHDEEEPSTVNIHGFVEEQEWHLYSHIQIDTATNKTPFKHTRLNQQKFKVSCKAGRRPGFFVWNIHLVMSFICALAFGTFAVGIELPQNRLQLSFTLVLTTITFKFVANQSIPKISYLTYLDRYILLSMCILMSVAVWHAVVPEIVQHKGEEVAKDADKIALAVLGFIFIIFQLIYASFVYFTSFRKRQELKRKDTEHQNLVSNTSMSENMSFESHQDSTKNRIHPSSLHM